MPILRVRDNDGNIVEIPAIKGDKGDKGNPGAGILIGSYTGGDGNKGAIDLGTKVDAVLIFTQYETEEDSNGFTIKGGFVAPGKPMMSSNGYELAYLYMTNPSEPNCRHILNVQNIRVSYPDGLDYMIYMCKPGVTYHYIAFVSEEG